MQNTTQRRTLTQASATEPAGDDAAPQSTPAAAVAAAVHDSTADPAASQSAATGEQPMEDAAPASDQQGDQPSLSSEQLQNENRLLEEQIKQEELRLKQAQLRNQKLRLQARKRQLQREQQDEHVKRQRFEKNAQATFVDMVQDDATHSVAGIDSDPVANVRASRTDRAGSVSGPVWSCSRQSAFSFRGQQDSPPKNIYVGDARDNNSVVQASRWANATRDDFFNDIRTMAAQLHRRGSSKGVTTHIEVARFEDL